MKLIDTKSKKIVVDGIPLESFIKDINLHTLIRENLLSLTRNFDKRVHSFLKHIVMGSNSGMCMQKYNYRVEFQLRGAAHIHGVLWLDLDSLELCFQGLKKAFQDLKLGEILNHPAKLVLIKFIDNFVTCSLSSELRKVVQEVQTHFHTKSCKKRDLNAALVFPNFRANKQ